MLCSLTLSKCSAYNFLSHFKAGRTEGVGGGGGGGDGANPHDSLRAKKLLISELQLIKISQGTIDATGPLVRKNVSNVSDQFSRPCISKRSTETLFPFSVLNNLFMIYFYMLLETGS